MNYWFSNFSFMILIQSIFLFLLFFMKEIHRLKQQFGAGYPCLDECFINIYKFKTRNYTRKQASLHNAHVYDKMHANSYSLYPFPSRPPSLSLSFSFCLMFAMSNAHVYVYANFWQCGFRDFINEIFINILPHILWIRKA